MGEVLIGVAFGVIGGMGLGGGVVMIPTLTLLMGYAQHEAQGMCLLAFLPMSACALILHIKQKRILFWDALWCAAGGAGGAVAGALAAQGMQTELLKLLFGCFLIVIGGIRLCRFVQNLLKNRAK